VHEICLGYMYLTGLYAGFGLGRGVCEHNYHSDRIAALAIYITGSPGQPNAMLGHSTRHSYELITCISHSCGQTPRSQFFFTYPTILPYNFFSHFCRALDMECHVRTYLDRMLLPPFINVNTLNMPQKKIVPKRRRQGD
jgi:hypothetical protein